MSMKTIHTDLPARPAHVALADHFADPGASQRPLRIRLTSGEEFDCHAPVFDIDHLVLIVTTSEGVTRKVRPADIETLYERRPRWPAYASLGLVTVVRSEEHTSELQSHSDLVCRLLLEKKKRNIIH